MTLPIKYGNIMAELKSIIGVNLDKTVDIETFKPKWRLTFQMCPEEILDSVTLLGEDVTAKALGEKLLGIIKAYV